PPHSSTTAVTTSRQACSSDTSSEHAMPCPPDARTAASKGSQDAPSTSVITTVKWSLASLRTTALPIPPALPVMSATGAISVMASPDCKLNLVQVRIAESADD